ncbi:Phosphoglycerate dehydrogenase [Thiohalomonas denitrificans]|uniref:Phosphoglycerate dehydrogenase n=2 Tax=Thiohalomonas denitrificans TaxID=415747 RepID=A0A1G5PVP8_9GAMM|nr:D-2-hydroxyacid dehydrogenase [Thiohalomonas denitrificans]SCZ53502.1 Phosphoglycerate dehydrogenase [Thiohalomonas denitrificans]
MAGTLPTVVVLTAPDEGWPPGLESLESSAQLLLADSPEALQSSLPEADILMVTDFRTTWLRDAWHRAQRLRWIHATSAGVDAILFPELNESDIPVTNARGIFDAAIAEYVLGLMLAFAKDLPGTLEHQRKHRWRHRDSERIAGKRVLVVGAGSIGRRIGNLARASGMHVEGIASRKREGDDDFQAIHGADSLYDLLPDADYVVIAAPLNRSTEGLFGSEAFSRMQPGARLINIGRGPIVQTGALVEALQTGRIAGAALDVFEDEPLREDHPLWGMPQVIVSPHMAGDFIGWREALSEQFVENFRRWCRGAPLNNLVKKSP